MRFFTLILLVALPLVAAAQTTYSNAPLLVVKPTQERPAGPAAPASPPSPQPAAKPPSPTAPPNPVTKLWPRDSVKIFMVSCTKLHTEMVKPCACIITKVMADIPHDEFLRIHAANQIESDAQLVAIRQQCTADLQQQQKRKPQGAQQ